MFSSFMIMFTYVRLSQFFPFRFRVVFPFCLSLQRMPILTPCCLFNDCIRAINMLAAFECSGSVTQLKVLTRPVLVGESVCLPRKHASQVTR